MLQNLIFDMGNVLIRYDPIFFIERAGIDDPADRELLLKEIFRSGDWPLLDLGELTEAELAERVYLRLPERLHDPAHYLIFNWEKPLVPIAGMAELIGECKRAGLGIYLLSNAGYRQSEYWRQIPGSEYFDGALVSAYTGFVKPMPEIYDCLLQRFDLRAEECLFVDDMPDNVAAAQRAGMEGFRFEGDVPALRSAIAARLGRGGGALC